jgi:hypothetical protein
VAGVKNATSCAGKPDRDQLPHAEPRQELVNPDRMQQPHQVLAAAAGILVFSPGWHLEAFTWNGPPSRIDGLVVIVHTQFNIDI